MGIDREWSSSLRDRVNAMRQTKSGSSSWIQAASDRALLESVYDAQADMQDLQRWGLALDITIILLTIAIVLVQVLL